MNQKCKLFSVVGFLLASTFIFLASPEEARAEVEIFKTKKDFKFSASGEVVFRSSYWNWFQSMPASAENEYNYFFARSRLGVSLDHPYIGAFVQGQLVNMWNLPDNSVAAPPQGPLGIGAIYSLHMRERSSHSFAVRQAYVDVPKLFLKGFSARIGRFDYLDGQEVMYADPKVNWLKRIRLSERLVGPFGWSSYNRSFDGFQLAYDSASFHLHGLVSRPTEGGFERDAHRRMADLDLVTVTTTLKYDEWIPKTEGRLFYYFYDDDRDISATPGQSGLDEGYIRIHTFGTHWLHTKKIQGGVLDLLFWGALQRGDWGAVNHEAWALAAEGGYQFSATPWTPWIRGGYFVSSGDTNPGDRKHETFYQLLPTARKYALFPFYNLMNSEDLFIQLILKPKNTITVRSDLHTLNLHERNDLWYMGAGPTQNGGSIFGYIGRPGNGLKDLATVFEIVGSYSFARNFSANIYYGHAFGGDVVKAIYTDDSSGDFFSIEFKAGF